MFDEKTQQELLSYVYILFDPRDSKPFYVGKGTQNRVFDHLNCALIDIDISTAKYDTIREIVSEGKMIKHIIVRHGLTESEAYKIEASLIDAFIYCGLLLSNQVGGHNSIGKGLMTTDELIRLYNAKPLHEIGSDCIMININRKYQRGNSVQSIQDATKETWTIRKSRLNQIKFVLSEYRGLIVEVFEVINWYEKERGFLPTSKRYGETKIGFGFNMKIASEEIRNLYINKSVAHTKKKGAASAIRYNL
ncbi:LEM-3-like GIY-YIG domain-containing protein [Kaistella polysaccharea]|uniref:LEM-3-like GIY-YIG domain-containing protein n=1 Tax=Kaistella polysaccharea TaxID=2878534 RepID=UPI001CF170E8|nr:hypothetical protein [Kaistella polysaccharea]